MAAKIVRERVADVVAALGGERYHELVGRLRGELAAIEAGAGLRPALHRLRGSSATLGLAEVAAALTAVEAMIGRATPDALRAAVAAIDPMVVAAMDALAGHDGGGAK